MAWNGRMTRSDGLFSVAAQWQDVRGNLQSDRLRETDKDAAGLSSTRRRKSTLHGHGHLKRPSKTLTDYPGHVTCDRWPASGLGWR